VPEPKFIVLQRKSSNGVRATQVQQQKGCPESPQVVIYSGKCSAFITIFVGDEADTEVGSDICNKVCEPKQRNQQCISRTFSERSCEDQNYLHCQTRKNNTLNVPFAPYVPCKIWDRVNHFPLPFSFFFSLPPYIFLYYVSSFYLNTTACMHACMDDIYDVFFFFLPLS